MSKLQGSARKLRLDLRVIASFIKKESRVLDLGCGEGELLEFLVKEKKVKGTGIEINESAIYSCVAKGLSVSHEDIDSGLKDYPKGFFDYVIFNQTMQQVYRPRDAIKRALTIGKNVIVGFPNFCHISARFQIAVLGRVPVTKSLPYNWYDTPNLHFLSIKDFEKFCGREGIKIVHSVFLAKTHIVKVFPNLFAYNAVYLLQEGNRGGNR